MADGQAGEADPASFAGADQLFKLIEDCYQRPRWGDVAGLPMICLIHPEAGRGLLRVVDRWLSAGPQGRVPHTYHDLARKGDARAERPLRLPAGGAWADVSRIARLLEGIQDDLSTGANMRPTALRFPRLRLALWLMRENLTTDDRGRRVERLRLELFFRLRDRHRNRDVPPVLPDGAPDHAPQGWLDLALRLVLRFAPSILLFARVAGRWPLGARYRWFLRRQDYLSPRDPGKFLGWAERLTVTFLGKENPEQVKLLLVNALLEDLRGAYRRFPRSLFSRRRTTYPIVLLDGITAGNGGYELLELINAVRNDAGARFDPLLVVAAGRANPLNELVPVDWRAAIQHGDVASPFKNPVKQWRDRLTDARRARSDTAWYLALALPEPAAGDPPALLDGVEVTAAVPRPRPWSYRWPYVVIVLVVLAGCLVAFGRWSDARCGRIWPGASEEVRRSADGACVGISDGGYTFGMDGQGGAADRLARVEQVVHRQNQQAEKMHADEPDRPYYTLVYMGILSSAGDEALATPLQQVEGVAARQNLALGQHNSDDPLFRVLFANEGAGAAQGETVARMVRAWARADPRIIGVVGLDDSREVTVRAIEDLYPAGLPVITPTLSYDGLPDVSPLYFQVNPRNDREAAADAAFARRRLHAKRVQIFSAGPRADKYSLNLSDDVARRMRAVGVAVDTPAYPGELTLGDQPIDAGERACHRPDSLVYYAGRGTQVEDFLTGMQRGGCGSGERPYVLADDDVARYVADPVSRHQTPVPIYYGALAFVQHNTPADRNFYNRLDDLFRTINGNAGTADSLDGHAALSYDAADAFADAVGARRAIGRDELWRRLRAIDFQGVTGRIAFNDAGSERVPARKQFGILHLDAASWKRPTVEGWCGDSYDPATRRYDTGKAASWCDDVDRTAP